MSPASNARPLFDHLSEIAESIGGARRVYLFLDFDGTLSPIAGSPEAATLPVETQKRLVELAGRKRFLVAIVSGRSLDDVRRKVGLEQLTYAGNHGLEIAGPDFEFAEPEALKRRDALHKLSRVVEIRMRNMTGTLYENKGLSASVHYRNASESDRAEVRQTIGDAVAPFTDLFRVSQGLEVLEIRPNVDWTKGSAARLMLESSDSPDALPVCLGDETTDEDMFSAFPEGITVRVGRSAPTAARYQLEFQEEVGEFLAWLAELDERLSGRGAVPKESRT
jgi:trehalose 6-phosphate phosphatase